MRGLMKTNLMPLMRTRAGALAPVAVVLMVPTGTGTGALGSLIH
jgi:hypothetical protein